MTTRNAFDTDLQSLSASLIEMGQFATEAVEHAITALFAGDKVTAQRIIEEDDMLDEMEHKIEQLCLRLLLKQQPVASDLRKISTAIKMITDIERIGDHAADIAEITLLLNVKVFPEIHEQLEQMANMAKDMAKSATIAYVSSDLALARKTRIMDDQVDAAFLNIRNILGGIIGTKPEVMEAAMDYLMIVKYLERIADHAENICEWVEYYMTGEKV